MSAYISLFLLFYRYILQIFEKIPINPGSFIYVDMCIFAEILRIYAHISTNMYNFAENLRIFIEYGQNQRDHTPTTPAHQGIHPHTLQEIERAERDQGIRIKTPGKNRRESAIFRRLSDAGSMPYKFSVFVLEGSKPYLYISKILYI